MSQEPTFPADAFASRGAAPTQPPAPTPTVPAPDAETAATGGEASALESVAAIKSVTARLWPAAGVAIGIGSAAVAAALLYRSRK